MRDSLSKSVQMAIEISTKSIERSAQHEAQRTEQKAKGELERQKLQNEKEAEEASKELLELQAVAAAVESTGQAKAEAQYNFTMKDKVLLNVRGTSFLPDNRLCSFRGRTHTTTFHTQFQSSLC
ncbi:PREDICTED: major vault protein-like [Amphimedon queenslandica]|uniref:Uncharacterized protein n=1 Tax=Amphimedon queenslandica TaxID=400682 RepID=A0AAN0IXB1_AMPQE|nr:PREDICTED: major vault protein-like [Amphimedon queenslandica]|eukprot:XP_019849400.1 PREDICTED: major vault protein-like [Amphimedon queenslandica]